MLIRKQGRIVRLVRIEPSKGAATAGRSRDCGQGVRRVVGAFHIDEPVPPTLLNALSRDERRTLSCWMAVYREEQARARAVPVLATVAQQFDTIVAALDAAADTLPVADAEHLWAQLQAISRALKRAGHARPRAARRPARPAPGQRDFFCETDEFVQPARQ
ncbi:hypothetical protein [Burkholderia ambifaria]|uniref:hypothetical protein n=1 Tax=Burkholderia ambifaria TaxID=152480 RepID=UPI00158A0161|nr:hypothetical protein [Burkholderia ambifaria]